MYSSVYLGAILFFTLFLKFLSILYKCFYINRVTFMYVYISICRGKSTRWFFLRGKKKFLSYKSAGAKPFPFCPAFCPWGLHVICRSDTSAPETLELLLQTGGWGNTPDLCHWTYLKKQAWLTWNHRVSEVEIRSYTSSFITLHLSVETLEAWCGWSD